VTGINNPVINAATVTPTRALAARRFQLNRVDPGFGE
jgi:hypothetical protein